MIKTCTCCGVTKDISEFYTQNRHDRPNSEYWMSACKECKKTENLKRYHDKRVQLRA